MILKKQNTQNKKTKMEPSLVISVLTCAILLSILGAECYHYHNMNGYERIR